MWLKLTLLIFVGFAAASQNPGWEKQHHYVYTVRGRSLAGLNQVSNLYSGIVFKAQLDIQPKSDGNLGAKVTNTQYAQVHAELQDGWDTEIPESQLNYQQLPLSDKPFLIQLEEGVVRNVIVDKQVDNWEANMIKSIVSQFQLDTNAKNRISSHINIFTQDDSNNAVFKTMEETVTGVSESLYDIHPYPEYVLPSNPWVVPQKDLPQGAEVIEIVKTKNFTHSLQAPSYHAGFEGIDGYRPGNKIGEFLSRSSVTRAVVTGSLEKYTIQNSVTVEEIALNPTLDDLQTGAVITRLNVTLHEVGQAVDENQYGVESPVQTGVVYTYDRPFSSDNSARPGKQFDHGPSRSSAESESDRKFAPRSRRSLPEHDDWHQDKPQLNEAPPSPLLPFTVGYDGQSFKKVKNIVEVVRKLAQEIGQEFSQIKEIVRQQTAGKFVTLVSLIRLMDHSEIERVANELHSSKESYEWIAFRDAVAQAGTGPALVVIKKWIQSGEVSDFEASQIITSAADATRQPTEEYMKFFFEMIQDESMMSKPYFNESALLSYTTLVRHVYVHRDAAYGKYPVYSYGSFRTERGRKDIKTNVIPYLTRQLQEAINKDDADQIYVYIRALGNIGQQHILEAYEPYLEGQRQASHFQRVLMIMSLDQLAEIDPQVARSVLYKIYQNPNEETSVRVAAVYQLIRTNPPASMLQRMAVATNFETNPYVNAAVQSVIEAVSNLEDPKHYELRAAGESAQPLLTNQEYGVQYSQAYLRSFVYEEVRSAYQQHLESFGNEDHGFPKGFKYNLQKRLGGVNQHLFKAHAMVSSVDDLLNVFKQQTKEYQRQLLEKQQHQAENIQWSSEYVAKLLNLQNEQREQLEGSLYVKIGALQSMLSFTNHTVENLAQVIQHLEGELQKGKHEQYNKMLNPQEYTLAVPTALGLPFIYTNDQPIFIHSEATVKASAKPEISNGEHLQKPDIVDGQFQIKVAISGRRQTQFGIFTPFDHQRYSSGYIKNFQVKIPLNGAFELDVQKHELKVELKNPASQKDIRLAHYSTWPYTAQNEIYSPKPTLKIIQSQRPYRRNIIVGDKSTGLAVYLQITSDSRKDLVALYEKLRDVDPVSFMLNPWVGEEIEHMEMNVGIYKDKSTTEKITMLFSYHTDYQQNEAHERKPIEKVSQIPSFAEDPHQRQKEFVDKLGKHISNAQVLVGDATIEFQGQASYKYSLTMGAAKSNVDPQGSFMALARKLHGQGAPTQVYVQATSKIPNTNGLNLDYAMQMDPTSTIQVQALLQHQQGLSKIEGQAKLSKSEERVQYIKEQQDYKECKHQMQQGNTQLPVCAKMTARANLLDKFSFTVQYHDMHPKLINASYHLYSFIRQQLYYHVEENIFVSHPSNQFDVHGRFSPDLESLNVSIVTDYGKVEIRNVELNPWVRELLVPHPVFHAPTRFQGKLLEYDTYRPICVIDKTETSTFDNKTYPTRLSSDWTVALQYLPRRPTPYQLREKQYLSASQQLQQNVESYVIYTREAQQGSAQKDVHIVLQMPATQGKVVKIMMKSDSSRGPRVFVNEQEVKYSAEKSFDFYGAQIQIYALPNQEVKLEVRNAFYVIFNGQTLKITPVNSKFRDASRGLCGTFTGEPETDFLAPNGCIIHQPHEFVEKYTVPTQPRRARSHFIRSAESQECYRKRIIYVNYISNRDAGRAGGYETRSSDDCTGHLSRYVKTNNGQICFSIRPLPFCKSHCKPVTQVEKPIDVYCMDPNPTSTYWRAQLDKNINQDFTMKQPNERIMMKIPARCEA